MAANNSTQQAGVPPSSESVIVASNPGRDEDVQEPSNGVSNKVLLRGTNDQQSSILLMPAANKGINYGSAAGGKLEKVSPQQHFENILKSRGYPNRNFNTLDTAYFCRPTELQKASYGSHLVGLVRGGDIEGVRGLLATGISPNACNEYGESLLHLICRKGKDEMLGVFLKYGASVQVADDYGRTPLHDACWAAEPSFELVETLLSLDCRLLELRDRRGSTPLNYVRKGNWNLFNDFLGAKKDTFWKSQDAIMESKATISELINFGPNTRSISDPCCALSPELASLVSNGRITAAEAQFLQYRDTEGESDSDDDDDDSDDDYSSCSDSSYNSDIGFDE